MKNRSKLWALATVAAVIVIVGVGCIQCIGCGGASRSSGSGNAHSHAGDSHSDGSGEYVIKYEWPEKPKIGQYTLKVSLADKSGAQVKDANVKVSYDMPSMRGAHATTETMKQNAAGDYLLPIHFAMAGDWEIVVSAQKDGAEIATETILLDI